jgi:hypothetical protein
METLEKSNPLKAAEGQLVKEERLTSIKQLGEKKIHFSEFERTEPEIGTLQSLRQLIAKSWI